MRCEHLRLIRAAAFGAALLAMAACDTVSDAVRNPASVFRRHPDQSSSSTAAPTGMTQADSDAFNAAYKAANEECQASLATPELDPIRHKVELLYVTGEEPFPFEIATNDSFATAEERPVIAKWAALRDVCLRRTFDVPIPPSASQLQTTMINQMRSFGHQVADDDNELTIALYQQKLTYAEFGRKRYEVVRALAAFKLGLSQAAAGSNNTQRQLEDLQAAQQQLTDTLDAFSKYVRAVQARKPKSVHLGASKEATR